MSIDIKDNSNEVLQKLREATEAGLTAIGVKATEYASKAAPVDTGRLRNSIQYSVDGNDVYIGTNVEYAAYVELGTGHGKNKRPLTIRNCRPFSYTQKWHCAALQ